MPANSSSRLGALYQTRASPAAIASTISGRVMRCRGWGAGRLSRFMGSSLSPHDPNQEADDDPTAVAGVIALIPLIGGIFVIHCVTQNAFAVRFVASGMSIGS